MFVGELAVVFAINVIRGKNISEYAANQSEDEIILMPETRLSKKNSKIIYSLNQPKFCPNVKWNSDATTFVDEKIIGYRRGVFFIDKNNTVYIVHKDEDKILTWYKDRFDTITISDYEDSFIYSMFVTNIGDIYISTNRQIIKWISSSNTFTKIIKWSCQAMFIDINNALYCLKTLHMKCLIVLLNYDETKVTVVVGPGQAKFPNDILSAPKGIFVDTNFDLYVADCLADRIHLFAFGQTVGKTVVGKNSKDITIELDCPTEVVLDAEKYLFISIKNGLRIIGSGPNGFRCLLGCYDWGSPSNQLHDPLDFSFDTYGNIFVLDYFNYRIQKFDILEQSCAHISSTIQATYSSILTTNHTIFSRVIFNNLDYYYEAIEIKVDHNAFYIISCNSSIDTYGHFYKNYFDPLNPSYNLIAWNVYTTYILVITTYDPKVIGPFTITISGSNKVIYERKNIQQSIQSNYLSKFTDDDATYFLLNCDYREHHFKAVQLTVNETGYYTFLLDNFYRKKAIHMYAYDFYPFIPSQNLIAESVDGCAANNKVIMTAKLIINIPYILVVTECGQLSNRTLSIKIFGTNNISIQSINTTSAIQSPYASELNNNSQKYSKNCGNSDFNYETIKVTVTTDGYYSFLKEDGLLLDYFLYENYFNPLNSLENLISVYRRNCKLRDVPEFSLILQAHATYILLVTGMDKPETETFLVMVVGPANVTLERFIDNSTYCYVGGPCNIQVKSIGLTLDDILFNEINRNMTISNQPVSIKMSATITIIMFVAGLINSICSLLTFKNKSVRNVGCGMYLFASSITSLLTISIFTVKFWFVVITQMNVSTRLSILRGGCKLIETFLKFFFYWDAWLNTCVAIERAFSVYKGIKFDKMKSKRAARWIIFILPFCIMATIIHESIYRQVFTHETKKEEYIFHRPGAPSIDFYVTNQQSWCTTSYSRSFQNYNTTILFIHLLGPFIANLCSALYIIIGSARRRANAQNRQTYKQHIQEQWKEHKQLIISPLIILFLTIPRLVISLLSGCIDVSRHPWVYLSAYFISFTPSILIFVVFVIPSSIYRKTFKESIFQLCRKQ
ncbi:hypothetical protein I4U23_022419 [Adineta vaga]|nr:hypothetical protein I4U23_022419 [Adineta vaga]